MSTDKIRNFCIIAHVDHGKSTLCDRLLEVTGTIDQRHMQAQVLDSHPISRERGITIKLAPVRMSHIQDNIKYQLNLIDTPGHIDFAYEVSRSLVACEGAILLVDAGAGIQAQTMSVYRQAKELGLKLIPVINKIDLPSAEREKVALDMVNLFNFEAGEILFISAKTGKGIEDVLETIIKKIPPPPQNEHRPLRALVFDSHYDAYLGAVADVRIVDGNLNKEKLVLLANQKRFTPVEIGVFTPQMKPIKNLNCGEVGYVATGLKSASEVKVGDTLVQVSEIGGKSSSVVPLAGYKEPKPMVFLGIYPVDNNDYQNLKKALEKLNLSDAAFSFQEEFSQALGKGFRCGFAGLLHAEVVKERLEQEFDLELIVSAPTVVYEYEYQNRRQRIKIASELPDAVDKVFEPWVEVEIFSPEKYMGNLMTILDERRGKMLTMDYLSGGVRWRYEMPLAELITDFFDKLKSISSGFASLDYKLLDEYREVEAVRLDILIHGEKVDALSQIVVKDKAYYIAREIVKKLKEVIPSQLFEVAIQAAIGSRVIARETLKSLRKDVTAKLYGGDQTRKDKLLKKQKKGKKRMKQFGKVNIPQEAFLAVLKRD